MFTLAESIKYLKIADKPKYDAKFSKYQKNTSESGRSGFSLVETTVAMVVFLVATLGVYTAFTYAVNYNAGNSSRAQALTVVQQEVELLRSAKFTSGKTDSILLGGVKTPKLITAPDGNNFRIQTIIDDDPFTEDIQVDSTKTLKEITVNVTLDRSAPGWQTAIPATIILRRVRGN